MPKTTTCPFCEASIDAGALAHNARLDPWERHQFDNREMLVLLERACINCFCDILRLQNEVPRRPYRSEYDVRRARDGKRNAPLTEDENKIIKLTSDEPKAHLARCVTRHTANIIAKIAKRATTKKRRRFEEEIVIHPRESGDRQKLMLEICADIANFRPIENRDMSASARRYGTAAFWVESSHFRRMRRSIGIKGERCRSLTPREGGKWNYDWDDRGMARRSIRNAFIDHHQFKESINRIEDRLKAGRHLYSYSYVWQQVYEASLEDYLTPLPCRLQKYKNYKKWRRVAA